jgi:hypothetical protein
MITCPRVPRAHVNLREPGAPRSVISADRRGIPVNGGSRMVKVRPQNRNQQKIHVESFAMFANARDDG